MVQSSLLNDGSLLIATVRHQYQMTGSLWNGTDPHTQDKKSSRYKGTRAQRYSRLGANQNAEIHRTTTTLMTPSVTSSEN